MLDPKTMQSGRYRLTCDVKNLLGSTLATGAVFDVDRNEGEGGVFELVAWSGRQRQPLAFGRGGSWSFADGSMGLGAAMLAALEAMPADAAPATAEPTPRERGQNTCRAALMTVIGLHRRGDGLLDAAPFIVAAVQALMDLDGLRAGEAAALDVAKERDEARALAEGLTRGQDDLRRQLAAMEAERDRADALSLRLAEETATLRNLHHGALAGLEEMTGRRDLAVQDRNEARERMKKAEAEAAVAGEALRIAEVERDRLQLENGRLREVCEDMQVQAGAVRRALGIGPNDDIIAAAALAGPTYLGEVERMKQADSSQSSVPTGPYPPYAGSGVLVAVRDGVIVECKRPAP